MSEKTPDHILSCAGRLAQRRKDLHNHGWTVLRHVLLYFIIIILTYSAVAFQMFPFIDEWIKRPTTIIVTLLGLAVAAYYAMQKEKEVDEDEKTIAAADHVLTAYGPEQWLINRATKTAIELFPKSAPEAPVDTAKT